MKRFWAFLLCAMILSFSLMLTGCGCAGCGTDNNTAMPDGGASAGVAGGMNGTNGTNSTNSTSGTNASVTTNGTGNLTDDLREGMDDLIDDADDMLDNGRNTIDGTPDGADTYGADRNTNLDDAGTHAATRTTDGSRK